MQKRGFICGAHRSGTTWLGKILETCTDCSVLHEPFNYAYGVESVPCWYPDAKVHNAVLTGLLADIFAGRARFKTQRDSDVKWKAVMRSITGGPDNIHYRRKLRANPKTLILKDPFVSRMAAMLCNQHDMYGVAMVRHPGAYLNALKRMGWGVPELGVDDCSLRQMRGDDAEEFAARVGRFWAQLNGDILDQVISSQGRIQLLRHEDLCENPLRESQKIIAHFGMQATAGTTSFLRQSTTGTTARARPGELHQFVRKTRDIPHSWRSNLSDGEYGAIMAECKEIYGRIYVSDDLMLASV
ncbi:hypothetical protein GCM10007939_02940 [Amylibacter marinus]|uniref:Sulfotransferase family protein n=1 Tax=Amylibacter marinus TaxID=1475483 RepID=A0ABQ5VS42_9RHOB|nr:sulfotransferase [Amylibacter marinus]GLQ34011.1 hypothetical protein GCM10007939_02940 [Amylibacter marinus]